MSTQDEIFARSQTERWSPEQTQQAFEMRMNGQDWRNPMAVNQPYRDMTRPLEDALSNLEPEVAYLINTVGSGVQRGDSTRLLLDQAAKGETVDSMRSQVNAARASDEALRLAEESLNLSDSEFNQLMEELRGEVEGRPVMPRTEEPESPSTLEQIISAGLSLAMPNQAFKIGAVPYEVAKQRRDEQYQVNVQRYGDQMARRAERIDLLENRVRIAETRRREAAENVRRLADDAAKQGQVEKANALNMRSKIYDAKTPEEIDDIMRIMRENFPPQYLPDRSVVDGLKSQLKAATQGETEKLQFQKDKESADREAAVLDDFRSWVDSNYPSGVSLGKEEVKIINAERQRWAKEHNVPLSKFPVYSERTAPATEGLNFSKERYDDGEELRKLIVDEKKLGIEKKKADLEKEVKASTPEEQGKKARRKQLSSLETKIDNARIAFEQHLQRGPGDDQEAYTKKMLDLFVNEYVLVSKKRQLAGGKAPSLMEFYRERFGGDSSFIPPPLSGAIGNLGKGTSQQGNPTTGPKLPGGVG
jgi:hypothetical protein